MRLRHDDGPAPGAASAGGFSLRHSSASWPVTRAHSPASRREASLCRRASGQARSGPRYRRPPPGPNCRSGAFSSFKNLADAGIADAGSNGSISPRSLAVPGMNWATPCAPAGLTAFGRNELSRQMSLVKKSSRQPLGLGGRFDDPAKGGERVVRFGTGVRASPLAAQAKRERGKRNRPDLRASQLHAPLPVSRTPLPAKAPML